MAHYSVIYLGEMLGGRLDTLTNLLATSLLILLCWTYICLLDVIQCVTLTFDLSMLPFLYSPVNLVSPTRFRFVYAFIFGAISSTLLGLVFSSRAITVIKVQTHYLDIFVNTSEFSVEWRRLPCFQRLHQSLTSLSFPPSPLFHLPLPFLLSLLLPFPPSFPSSLTFSCESNHYDTGVPVSLLPPVCLCGHSFSSDRTHHWSLVHMHSVSCSNPCKPYSIMNWWGSKIARASYQIM